MLELLKALDAFVWGPPLLLLLVGTGIYLTIRLGLLQLVRLPKAFQLIFTKDKGHGDVSSFAALCTALAATVGTGNIIGVATAIKVGGPGALFWMWMAAFFGMATKYAEGLLAIKYRTKDANGAVAGGPMHYILLGMGEKWRPLAIFFALAGVLVALLGIGTFTQVNSITESIQNTAQVNPAITALILSIFVGIAVFGGLKSISKVSTAVVPFMAIVYILGTLTVILFNIEKVPATLALIFTSAFSPVAAVGGFAGASIRKAIQNGVARGVFSNESGLGSAPIAAAAAKTNEPVEQGLISMTGTFIDTLIICTLTGLTILVTGVWSGDLNGVALTQSAFSTVFSYFGPALLTIFLVLFAFTTILGWNYYGERCFEFLFGVRFIWLYRVVFVVMVLLGGFIELDMVWIIADIVNALMALPNLIALLVLSPVVVAETKKYFKN
ncbi:alanine/glycine:cation symporter family protein [Streptococcus oralis]|uniref:Sodium:alanine symporter n=2 Tax=Streptococcus oralis subsp. tigurinus TaxID=1077464 RepID=S9SM88_STROR|nr:sodium:alanine symporter family protein [Streptococcus oralis]EMG35237.1 Na+/alanine symporter [Streptococcus oralis subsp. tigurinus 1366]EPX90080.1 sodium:alanine symporter [Streptococcus oralis subsp. tigurinus 2425]EPX91215.1 sodium:alanine symporter [Streptococcus oralis subsp. tigurinus 2426]BBA07972.1 Sodium:alanine symporter [Streptococcus oralis subsp. tigurinus]